MNKSINHPFYFIIWEIFKEGTKMLVLGRKPGEYVVIDGKIRIEVVKSEKGDLRLAIDAPREMEIVRGEIYEKQAK